jgi:hypothetical protein
MRLSSRLGIALAATLIACTDPTQHPVGCQGNVDINVGLLENGTGAGVPLFGWAPPCGVTSVIVETVPAAGGAGVLVWQVSAPERAQIAPSVVYGRTPSGATALHAAQPLQTGVTYRVSVTSTVGGDAAAGSGTITFQL